MEMNSDETTAASDENHERCWKQQARQRQTH